MKSVGERVKQWFDVFGYECHGHNPDPADGLFLPDRSNVRFECVDIRYGPLAPIAVKPITVARSIFVNNGGRSTKQIFNVSGTTTSSFSYAFQVSGGVRISVSTVIPFLSDGDVVATLRFEASRPRTLEVEQAWTNSTEITVGPHRKVAVSFIVHETSYSVPFMARVQALGSVRIACPGRYPRSQNEASYWDAEIRDMLTQFGPDYFAFDVPGRLDAVHGIHYEVRMEEFDLAVRSHPGDEAPLSRKVIDAGQIVNRAPRATLREMRAAVRRVENVPV